MKLLKKYLTKINESSDGSLPSGFHWMNPYIKDIPLKNVSQLEFESLYPKIICGLVKEGYHELADSKIKKAFILFAEKFDYFNKNKTELKKNSENYIELKKDINSFYGKLGYYSAVDSSPNYPQMVTSYIKEYYTDFLDKNAGKILYIDVDTVFYCDSIDVLDIDVLYSTKTYRYAMFNSMKNYVTFEHDYSIFGFRKTDARDAIDVMKTFIRNDKIEKLGI